MKCSRQIFRALFHQGWFGSIAEIQHIVTLPVIEINHLRDELIILPTRQSPGIFSHIKRQVMNEVNTRSVIGYGKSGRENMGQTLRFDHVIG